MERGNVPTRTIKTSKTIFGIIEILTELNGGTVTEVANELDMAPSTIHDHLSTLESLEYVVREGNEYRLGLKFLDHGTWVKRNYVTVTEFTKPVLEQLANETGESVWLIVEEHGRAIYLQKAMGERSVQTEVRIGLREYLHPLAAGKAILAYLPERRVNEIIDRHGLQKYTEDTITDRDDLFDELKTIRDRGYSLMDNELIDGLRAVGSVIQPENDVYGAVAVTGPADRIRGQYFRETIPNEVVGATNEIELKMKYDQDIE